MNTLNWAAATVGRAAVWLLPAGRRDWVAAVWAEAHEVPLAGLAGRRGLGDRARSADAAPHRPGGAIRDRLYIPCAARRERQQTCRYLSGDWQRISVGPTLSQEL
jgi:hypothetical protein